MGALVQRVPEALRQSPAALTSPCHPAVCDCATVQPCSGTVPWGSRCCPCTAPLLPTSSPPCTDEGQSPTGKLLPAPGLSEHLFSCFFVFWSVAIINEIEGEPHSLSLPLPTHINLNANSLRKIKINYTFCSRLHGKWKCTGLAFPFSPWFFGSAKEKQCRKILTYASQCCMLGCFFSWCFLLVWNSTLAFICRLFQKEYWKVNLSLT